MIRTERLLLRRWVPEDHEPFAALNTDARVMRYLPSPLSRQESDDLAERIEADFEKNGFGLWAMEVPGVARFVGFVGLAIPRFEAHFTPTIEIGWRIAAEYWNRGYATEGAQAVLRFAFERLHLHEIVSFTVPSNLASIRVMEKIGMKRDEAGDFEHPSFPVGHPLRWHVLYRIDQPTRPNAVKRPSSAAHGG